MSKRPPARGLTSTVLAHANKVHGVLVANERAAAAERLTAEAERWGADATTAVIAGDIKRGKSSLVNALIARPALLPVDADVATAVHLVVRYGETDHISVAYVDEAGQPATKQIEPGELAEYASMRGDEAVLATVSAVDVAVDHPLLERGLALIDTPGVGGMTRGHRDTTMAALGGADVLVFVVSLQQPVARTELEFLAEASERIGNVALAFTGADLGTEASNAEMVADTRRRLRTLADEIEARGPGAGAEIDAGAAATAHEVQVRRLRRLAERPAYVTSSYLAEAARIRRERGREEAAAVLEQQSGIAPLAAYLGRAAEAREMIRLANLLQLGSGLLAELEDDVASRARAADGDSSVEAELQERQEQLERAVGQQARWRATLNSSINRLQTATGRDVSRELTAVRDRYRDMLEAVQRDEELEPIVASLQQSLQASWSNLSAHATREFDGIVASLLRELEVEGVEHLLGELEMPPGIQSMTSRAGMGDNGFDMLEDGLPLATQTFLFGNIANAVVGVLGVATGGLGLLAYGAGVALSAPITIMRRKQRMRRKAVHELQREVNEALFGQEGIAREFTTDLTLRIIDAREHLEIVIEERLVARRKELDARRRELQSLLQSEQTTRAAARRQIERAQAELAAVTAETARLAGEVDAALEAHFAEPTSSETTAGDPAVPNPTTPIPTS